MSIASYADLQARVADWLARDDLTGYIPDMITLFEAAAARKLRVRPQQATASITTAGGIGALPSGYLGHSRVTWLGTSNLDLTYVHPSIFTFDNPSNDQGTPQVFTIEASSIKVSPIDDSGLEMLYFQKAGALANALNWLFNNHPDAYLFGTLAEANYFNRGKALDMANLWMARRDAVFDEIQKLDFNERSGMAIRVMGATP